MLVSDVIKSSMRKLGLLASGETPTTSEYADALLALQVMLRGWSTESITVFASVKESFSLAVSTSSYTWGTGGVITTARPNTLLGAYILDSESVSNYVDVISEGKYRGISSKGLAGRPTVVYPHMGFPLVTLYVYPVPTEIEVMYLDSFKPFTETSSFDSTGSTLSFPLSYEEAIIYNLSVRIAPEFGKPVSAEVASIAAKSYDRITNTNASKQVESISPSLPIGRSSGSGYSIESDSYT